MIQAVFTLIGFIAAAFIFAGLLRPASRVEYLCTAYVFWGASVFAISYFLASLDWLARVDLWAWCGIGLVVSGLLLSKRIRGDWFALLHALPKISVSAWRSDWQRLPWYGRATLGIILSTFLLTAVLSLMVAIILPPGHWDSMTYHLPRMAFYLQFGNLDVFNADYYPQVIFAKGSTLLLIWAYLASGRSENLLSLLQYSSYLISVVAVFGVARLFQISRLAALAAALIYGLYINVLLEATTTQNDLVLAAYLGIGVFFLISFGKTGRGVNLWVALASLAIASAVKNTFVLFVPSILLVMAVALVRAKFLGRETRVRDLGLVAVGVLLFVAVAFPAGYWDNWKLFGNPLGPPDIFALESTEDEAFPQQLVSGVKNSARTALDLVSLDGLPETPLINQVQWLLRLPPVTLVQTFAPNLETQPELGASYKQGNARAFTFARPPRTHADESFWGIIGVGITIPLVMLTLAGIVGTPDTRCLALASVTAFVVLCFALDYESWHGRRLVATAWFCAPCIAWLLAQLWQTRLTRPGLLFRALNSYVMVVLVLACVSAISAVIFEKNSALYPRDPASVWTVGKFKWQDGHLESDRLALMMRNRTDYLTPMRAFDAMVPPSAIVATVFPWNVYEYPLFGEKLTRTILPLNAFLWGKQPIPPNAQYLLYARGLESHEVQDVYLGADWYLRRLNGP